VKLFDLFENMSQVIKFLSGKERNAWLRARGFDVYVRKGFHRVDGDVITCFDIANIEQQDEAKRGKGKFKAFVVELKKLLESDAKLRGDIKAIYVESVLNKRLESSLPSMGFKREPNTEPPSFSMKLTS